MMKTYYEKAEECSTWLKVSKRALKLVLWEVMKSKLSKSKDSYLEGLFETILVDPIIQEVKVSMPWLQTFRPDLIKDIERKIDPSEDINEFFKELNDTSNGELSLKTLIGKRIEFIAYAEEFKKTIDVEQQRLEKELEKL